MLKKQSLFIIFITFFLQCPTLKIGFVKISEILLLLSTVYVINNIKDKKTYFLFIFFFIALLSRTIVGNINTKFFINNELSFIQSPYLLSIGRFFELITCINIAGLVSIFLQECSIQTSAIRLLRKLIHVQYVLMYFFIFYFIVAKYIIQPEMRFIVYNSAFGYGTNFRLSGFYNEGGPFGLYYGFIFILSYILPEKRKYYYIHQFFLILLVVFCAQSKAGMLLLAICFLYHIYRYTFEIKKMKMLFPIILIVCVAAFFLIVSKVSDNYIQTLKNLNDQDFSESVDEEAIDPNLVMGRVSGVFITQNMIIENPFLGIGLGNYPIVRNNPDYKGSFPAIPVDLWDAHGLGGMMDVLIDGGFVFLIIFIFIFFHITKNIRNAIINRTTCAILFFGPLICGVQIHFLYVWIIIGIIMYINNALKKPKFAYA